MAIINGEIYMFKISTLLIILLTATAFTPKINLPPKTDRFIPILAEETATTITVEEFNRRIAKIESRNKHTAVNKRGTHFGLYQFSVPTIKMLGFKNITIKQFINNPRLQHDVMLANTKFNQQILHKEIEKFDGKIVNGVRVTRAGILAGAHLAGPGNVKKFLRSGRNFTDGNISIARYMEKFSNVQLSQL
jgi:hypothetical protein